MWWRCDGGQRRFRRGLRVVDPCVIEHLFEVVIWLKRRGWSQWRVVAPSDLPMRRRRLALTLWACVHVFSSRAERVGVPVFQPAESRCLIVPPQPEHRHLPLCQQRAISARISPTLRVV